MTDDLNAVAQSGVIALQQGDAAAARLAFERVERAGRGTHQLRLLLAQACMLLADHDAAHQMLDRVLAEEPANLYALIMRGDLLTAADNSRAAVSWYQAALMQAPRVGQLPADLIGALQRAEHALANANAAFQAHLDTRMEAAGVSMGAAGARFAEALEILAGRAQVQLQQPTSFYYPGLAARPFFERSEFAWVEAMERGASDITAELEVLLTAGTALTPYVIAEPSRPAKRHPLLGDPKWSALHLFRSGTPVPENVACCPATIKALRGVPMPALEGRSPTVLFSVLRAGTHIPPHTGMLNTRLICHLPLIVPPHCRLRVGNETRTVERGKILIFDDSIEHEAWNDSDDTRVVLIFEIWRPELDVSERAALTALYEAIGGIASAVMDQAGA